MKVVALVVVASRLRLLQLDVAQVVLALLLLQPPLKGHHPIIDYIDQPQHSLTTNNNSHKPHHLTHRSLLLDGLLDQFG